MVSFVPMEALGIQRKEIGATVNRTLSEVQGSYTYFANGDVLLAKITPCFENGKLGIASGLTNGVGFGSSEYIVLRPSACLTANFLYYFLLRDSFRETGARNMTGTAGQKRVTKTYVESSGIPTPPLKEQERIVAVLDEAFEGIDRAEANAVKNKQNAQSLFAGFLQSRFSEVWKDSRLVKLSDLATDITDGDHLPPPKSAEGVPFVTISNINKESHRIDFTDTFFVPRDYFEKLKPNKRPRKGDLLYTVTGSFGIPVKVERDFEFCFQRHIGLVRPRPDVCTSWLYYLMRSPQILQQADERATGTAQRTVSLAVLRSFSVPKIGLECQRSMASKLDQAKTQVERMEAVYACELSALAELKQSLLHQAFTCKL